MPAALERRLGDGVLELLDAQLLQPSRAPRGGQIEAVSGPHRRGGRARRARAALPAPVFRGSRLGPAMNAFALPGGTVVVLDELVRRTDGDDRLTAVLGHELAHLTRRHSAEALVRGAGITGLAGLLWGDFSSAAANLPAALAVLGYSRDAERQADDDAIRFLRGRRRARPRRLAALLCLFAEEGRSDGIDPPPGALRQPPEPGGAAGPRPRGDRDRGRLPGGGGRGPAAPDGADDDGAGRRGSAEDGEPDAVADDGARSERPDEDEEGEVPLLEPPEPRQPTI